jgi:hypothetical protein
MQRINSSIWERSQPCVDCDTPIPAGIIAVRCEPCAKAEDAKVVERYTGGRTLDAN